MLKTKRVFLIPAAVALLLCTAVLFFGEPAARIRSRQLKQALAQQPAGQTDLETAVPFAWDCAYSFAPYASREEMEKELGTHSRLLQPSVSEEMQNVVFLHRGKVTAVLCGRPEQTGCSLRFARRIKAGEHRPFAVEHKNGTVYLTEQTAAGKA